MKIWLKIFSACLASLLFLVAMGIFAGSIQMWGGRQNLLSVVFSLLLAFLACYGLAWVNTGSFRRSFIGALGGILLGLPLSFLLLVPFGYWLADWLFPLSNLGLSGSLDGAWFLLGIVAIIEILTDRLHINDRWLMMVVAVAFILIVIYGIEVFTAIFGLSGTTSVLKLLVYTPLIWGSIVGVINIRSADNKMFEKEK